MTRWQWLNYHSDFVTFPLILFGIVSYDTIQFQGSPLLWLIAFALGAIAWTFAEYWIHRSVLHGFMWMGKHENHHLHPRDHVQFPFYAIPAGFVGIYAVTCLVLWGLPDYVNAAYAGIVFGYCWFVGMHHLLHHIDDLRPYPWLYGYAIQHNAHHKLVDRNYGITTDLWDRLFGTKRWR